MLQQKNPDDFVVATGETHSVCARAAHPPSRLCRFPLPLPFAACPRSLAHAHALSHTRGDSRKRHHVPKNCHSRRHHRTFPSIPMSLRIWLIARSSETLTHLAHMHALSTSSSSSSCFLLSGAHLLRAGRAGEGVLRHRLRARRHGARVGGRGCRHGGPPAPSHPRSEAPAFPLHPSC